MRLRLRSPASPPPCRMATQLSPSLQDSFDELLAPLLNSDDVQEVTKFTKSHLSAPGVYFWRRPEELTFNEIHTSHLTDLRGSLSTRASSFFSLPETRMIDDCEYRVAWRVWEPQKAHRQDLARLHVVLLQNAENGTEHPLHVVWLTHPKGSEELWSTMVEVGPPFYSCKPTTKMTGANKNRAFEAWLNRVYASGKWPIWGFKQKVTLARHCADQPLWNEWIATRGDEEKFAAFAAAHGYEQAAADTSARQPNRNRKAEPNRARNAKRTAEMANCDTNAEQATKKRKTSKRKPKKTTSVNEQHVTNSCASERQNESDGTMLDECPTVYTMVESNHVGCLSSASVDLNSPPPYTCPKRPSQQKRKSRTRRHSAHRSGLNWDCKYECDDTDSEGECDPACFGRHVTCPLGITTARSTERAPSVEEPEVQQGSNCTAVDTCATTSCSMNPVASAPLSLQPATDGVCKCFDWTPTFCGPNCRFFLAPPVL
eukprot:TRINITY_DN67860_c13_g7_i1.p1 TRINITY_DN67860_c13_g7~~TRINITY_DN67860_c13_g7_i1.p1  ORF type:complete len:486 (-),score=27.68 TRINITY_DN67860_c13_g7_i1:140-1597(-)